MIKLLNACELTKSAYNFTIQSTLTLIQTKTMHINKNILATTVISIIFSFVISGCSDDDKQAQTEKAETPKEHVPISHTLIDTEASVSEKQKFEKDFANQCVQRELNNDANADKASLEKSCECVATFMMKDLTAIEAEKFIAEHEKNVQSLRIKYENAAYHCLQQNAHPNGPNFSRN